MRWTSINQETFVLEKTSKCNIRPSMYIRMRDFS